MYIQWLSGGREEKIKSARMRFVVESSWKSRDTLEDPKAHGK